jgi:hypothetical protein
MDIVGNRFVSVSQVWTGVPGCELALRADQENDTDGVSIGCADDRFPVLETNYIWRHLKSLTQNSFSCAGGVVTIPVFMPEKAWLCR